VLIADDDPSSRQVTRLQIARLGYGVDEADGGAAAVRAAAVGAYELILLDCQMPDMDGLAATAEIRKQETANHRSFIVALTADVSPEQRRRCRAAGMDEFLEKPLRLQTLADLLNRHVRRDAAASSEGPPAVDAGAAAGLERLQTEIGAETTLELVREYRAGVEQACATISRLDPAGVRTTAHRLLGGARVLGLVRFERIWAPLLDGETVDAGVSPAVLDELRSACAELGAWIDSHQGKKHV
jgi:CheY-like chemotaxis protein